MGMDKIIKNRGWIGPLIAVAIPLAVGGIAALLTSGEMAQFSALRQPPLSPPPWLFPVAWTILYILMGLSSYLLFVHVPTNAPRAECRRKALFLYVLQLFFNFCWPLFFFNAKLYFFSFAWLLVMWLLIISLTKTAFKVEKTAASFLLPYLLWTTFAGYLNIMIALLN